MITEYDPAILWNDFSFVNALQSRDRYSVQPQALSGRPPTAQVFVIAACTRRRWRILFVMGR